MKHYRFVSRTLILNLILLDSVRGEYTKTRTDRTIFLTEEIKHQLNTWLNYKYRARRVCYKTSSSKSVPTKHDEQNGKKRNKTITEIRTPEKKESDLVFRYIKIPKEL